MSNYNDLSLFFMTDKPKGYSMDDRFQAALHGIDIDDYCDQISFAPELNQKELIDFIVNELINIVF